MFAFAALALLLTPTLSTVTDCSNGASLFKLTSMSFSPDPTVPGQNSTLLLTMNVPTQVTNGTASYASSYNFIPLTPSTDPLCYVTVDCPIQAGTLNTRSSYAMPTGLSGSLQIQITWKDLDGNLLMCARINTKLGDSAKQLAVFKGRRHGKCKAKSKSNRTRF